MPQTVKETRRPELRLPEIKRDEIVRALSEIRLPDVDLSKIDWSRIDLSKIERPKVELPDIDLRRVDVRRAMEDAAIRAGVRERTRSRWPIVAALAIAAGLGLFALLRRPTVRAQVEESAKKARARIEQMRLERETDLLTSAEIEAAVGTAADTAEAVDQTESTREPVAVGPGRRLPWRRTKAADDATVSASLDATDEMGETVAGLDDGTSPALEETASIS